MIVIKILKDSKERLNVEKSFSFGLGGLDDRSV